MMMEVMGESCRSQLHPATYSFPHLSLQNGVIATSDDLAVVMFGV